MAAILRKEVLLLVANCIARSISSISSLKRTMSSHTRVSIFSALTVLLWPLSPQKYIGAFRLFEAFTCMVQLQIGSPSLRGIDEFVRGEKREEKQNKGLFFVEPEKNTNVRNRRTKPCQISIPKATEKREP